MIADASTAELSPAVSSFETSPKTMQAPIKLAFARALSEFKISNDFFDKYGRFDKKKNEESPGRTDARIQIKRLQEDLQLVNTDNTLSDEEKSELITDILADKRRYLMGERNHNYTNGLLFELIKSKPTDWGSGAFLVMDTLTKNPTLLSRSGKEFNKYFLNLLSIKELYQLPQLAQRLKDIRIVSEFITDILEKKIGKNSSYAPEAQTLRQNLSGTFCNRVNGALTELSGGVYMQEILRNEAGFDVRFCPSPKWLDSREVDIQIKRGSECIANVGIKSRSGRNDHEQFFAQESLRLAFSLSTGNGCDLSAPIIRVPIQSQGKKANILIASASLDFRNGRFPAIQVLDGNQSVQNMYFQPVQETQPSERHHPELSRSIELLAERTLACTQSDVQGYMSQEMAQRSIFFVADLHDIQRAFGNEPERYAPAVAEHLYRMQTHDSTNFHATSEETEVA